MESLKETLKRVMVGRPIHSSAHTQSELPKFLALPVFSPDLLSSNAYAPDEILLTLALGGVAFSALSVWVGLAVVAVLALVIFSYRQTILAYPQGGGYEVATTNLGSAAGLGVASALLLDYVLIVSVSIASGASYIASAFPALEKYRLEIALILILFLALLNLRGVRTSGRLMALPVYLYIAVVGLVILVGAAKYFAGVSLVATSSSYQFADVSATTTSFLGLGGALLFLRAFSSGCAELTGAEAISNGVNLFKKPKAKNAGLTLLILGLISSGILLGVVSLASAVGIKYVSDPTTQLLNGNSPVDSSYVQEPVLTQLVQAVFGGSNFMVFLVGISAGLVLILAANTAFNAFPNLANTLSRDSFLPHQLSNRGDRLVYSNGVIVLALLSSVFLVVFQVELSALIQLYVVSVFICFTLTQAGLVVHFTRRLTKETSAKVRRSLRIKRLFSTLGTLVTAVVLLIVSITRFLEGAWASFLVIIIFYLVMLIVHRHYKTLSAQLEVPDLGKARTLPTRVRGIILVTSLNKPTMRAISFARATRPFSLEAVTVERDPAETKKLVKAWETAELPIPLTILGSPYRELLRPIGDRIKALRREHPEDVVVIFLPEYVVSSWWEKILHNHTSNRIKRFLLQLPNVVVSDVPYQISSNIPNLNSAAVGAELLANAQKVEADLNQDSKNKISFVSLGMQNSTIGAPIPDGHK